MDLPPKSDNRTQHALLRWGRRHNTGKVVKGTGKNPRKKWKNRKMCWESLDSFQNYDSRRSIFVYRLALAQIKGNLVVNSVYDKFCFEATSFEIWASAWSSASTGRFHQGCFSFLDRMVLFLSSKGLLVFCFSLFYQGLSSAFDFSSSRDFSKSIELPRLNFKFQVRNVNKICK